MGDGLTFYFYAETQLIIIIPIKTLVLATLHCYLKGEGGVPCSCNRISNRH